MKKAWNGGLNLAEAGVAKNPGEQGSALVLHPAVTQDPSLKHTFLNITYIKIESI